MNNIIEPAQLKVGLRVGIELDPYVLNHPIGNGQATWIADQGGRPFVLRFFQPNRGQLEHFLLNARKYAGIKHPSITPNYPPFNSPLWVYSISSVCGGEKLFSYLGKYPDGAPLNVVVSLFDSIAKGLDKVHENNLCHGHLDLSSVQVVNGLGIMIGFGSYNWMTNISETEMDFRFAPPEYLKPKHDFTPAADKYAFMRLILSALLGESKIDSELKVNNLPDEIDQLSHDTWKKIKKWSRPAQRHRPKSLVEVVRILRADMYTNTKTKAVKPKSLATNPKRKAIATTAVVTVIAGVSLSGWNPFQETEIPVKKTEPAKVAEAPEQPSFEELPAILEEPLKVEGKAPQVIKLSPAIFTMGDSQGIGDDNEKPVHQVDIPTGFYLSRYEVTFDQFDKFANETNRELPPDNGWGRGNRPVINVSWYDAKAYAAWLTEQTGQEYRLPTEVEWEYSVRANSETSYWYGNEMQTGYSVCDDCGSQWDGRSTAPVGSQISNPFGLFDMHGNVAEWIEDCYHDSYAGAPSNNRAWLSSDCPSKVIRGGSWYDIPRVGRSSTRYRADPNLKASNWGFRVVRIIRNDI